MTSVNLVILGKASPIRWTIGETYYMDANPRAVGDFGRQVVVGSSENAWLFWDNNLGQPDEDLVLSLLRRRMDVWHSGLLLGLTGLPKILDFANPTWVFSRDPACDIEATSWRLSLRACLIRTDVIRELGFIHRSFHSLNGAGLELGYRYLRHGALLRHTPRLSPQDRLDTPLKLSLGDEILFLHLTHGQNSKYWAVGRGIIARAFSPFAALRAARDTDRVAVPRYKPFTDNQAPLETVEYPLIDANVTVLLPTVDRYPYLRTLLTQLREQTVRPLDIVIVDQTEADRRDISIITDFSDLPLTVIYQESAGQCSSRNAGLYVAKGDYILFLDDDDEIEQNLIAKHLLNLHFFEADTSSGGVDEVGALPLTGIFNYIGMSGVFPTNNTLIRKDVLLRSGLFDLAYNRGQGADGDLGMRIYLSGALMIYNPQISVLHHHAPSGGLRKHKARVITYSSSRQKLFHRRFPHRTEVYRMKRYFTPRQVRESLWMSVAGTFSIRGGFVRKLLKIVISTVLFPHSIYRIRQRVRDAEELLKTFPDIPVLNKTSNNGEGL